MGKNIISQRRGRGTLRYRSQLHRFKHFFNFPKTESQPVLGKIIELTRDVSKSAPLAIIKYENGSKAIIPAPLGVREGTYVTLGLDSPNPGNIMELSQIPDGTNICAIEKLPGSGPIFCRTAGSSARILSKINNEVTIEFPSKKQKRFDDKCRAVIGIISGSGKREKPVLKAGKMHHIMQAKNKLYPVVSGVAMNAVDHPFGSGRGRHMGKPATAPRNAPPGRKVGLIRAKRTGRGKK